MFVCFDIVPKGVAIKAFLDFLLIADRRTEQNLQMLDANWSPGLAHPQYVGCAAVGKL